MTDLTLRADSKEETNVKVNEKIEELQSQILDLKRSPKLSYAQVTASNNQEQQRHHEHSEVVTVSRHCEWSRIYKICNHDLLYRGHEHWTSPSALSTKMKITRVFKPATLEDTERIYVEFENEMNVKIVNRYRRNLAVGLRIFPWFPPAQFPRFKALDDESYQLRKVR